MRPLFFLFLLGFSIHGMSQSIRMKVAGVASSSAGEEVLAFQLTDTLPYSFSSSGGFTTGTVRFEPAKIKKLRGASTNDLFRYSTLGTLIPQVTFEFLDASNQMFYRIILRDAVVIHFSFLSPECPNCSSLFHQVWFGYRKIECTDVATGNTVQYDLTTGTK